MKKFLLVVISLLGIAGSICILSMFIYIPLLTDELSWYVELYPWLSIVFAVNMAFTSICYLLLLCISIFIPRSLSAVAIKNQSGHLQFSKQSLESAIRYSYSEIEEVNFSKIKIKLNRNPEKIKVYVRLSLKDPNKLMSLTSTIQTNIESAIKDSLGMTVKSVNLEVMEVAQNNTVADSKGKNARVV